MKTIIFLFTALMTLSCFGQDFSSLKIKNKKNGDEMYIKCVDSACEQIAVMENVLGTEQIL
jgi:hypothetical protein